MNSLRATFRHHATPARARKLAKYTAASIISVIVTQAVLFVATYWMHWKGGRAQLFASSVAAVPSYYLNRSWVWRKNGRSHFRREVIPFWVMVFVGLGVAAFVGMVTDIYAVEHNFSREMRTLALQFASIASFGALWVAKFIIFNKVLFAHKPIEELDPVLDGRSGLPT